MIYACFTEPGTEKRGEENSFISAYCAYVRLCVCLCLFVYSVCVCVCERLAGRWGIVKIMDCT